MSQNNLILWFHWDSDKQRWHSGFVNLLQQSEMRKSTAELHLRGQVAQVVR